MRVFGDLETLEPAREGLETCAARFAAALEAPAHVHRHCALVNAYVETSRLAQGCVDDEFRRVGQDDLSPLHEAAIAALRAMAKMIAHSWRNDPCERGVFDMAPLRTLIDLAPRDRVRARVAEGFAFYALFPESCLLPNVEDDRAHVVIGARSIGMALAPLLAEALAASLCLTLRPVGHPFARACALSPELGDILHARGDARFCIIDEGPGLSGSSFGSVADALEGLGVARSSIEFFPSHPGAPGRAASRAHRERWSHASRRVLDSAPAIARALKDYTILRDMSGGLWREGHAHRDAAANRPFERRKILVEDACGQWLMTFSGLGDIADHKARMAHDLCEAGFTPQAAPSPHGFIAHRWIAAARRIDVAPRAAIIEHIASYVAFRTRGCPALPYGGASVQELYAMTLRNVAEGLGQDAAAALAHLAPRLDGLARMEQKIATDNRMHKHEWLCDESERILKCDAVDHCAAHDLVGCQDPSWDVAGAIVEFDMDETESGRLLDALARAGVTIEPALLEFNFIAYCAFQLGASSMAAEANAQWPQDALGWRRERERYATNLRALTGAPQTASRARSRSTVGPRPALPR